MGHYHDVVNDLREPTKELRTAIPGVFAGFGQLHDAAFAEGALSTKTKELIALTIAVIKQCDGCIALHARAAARHGAGADEVAEALGVAVLMDGGPATVYGPRALAAYHEFADPAVTPATTAA
jgi:AhpD family alkylhydroperoxidase